MAEIQKLDTWNMTNDAVKELFRYTEQQEKKYAEADRRIAEMQRAEMSQVRTRRLDDLPLRLR